MQELLTLNDGTVWTDSSAILSGSLFLYVKNETMRDVFDALIDPEKTARIVYTMNNGDTAAFDGFTRLRAVRDEGGGLITAVLERGE